MISIAKEVGMSRPGAASARGARDPRTPATDVLLPLREKVAEGRMRGGRSGSLRMPEIPDRPSASPRSDGGRPLTRPFGPPSPSRGEGRGRAGAASAWLFALLLLLAPGCGSTGPDEAPPALRATVVEGEGWPRRATDSVGRTVELERPATRVVSLAPSNTEILFAIGAGDAVVGVTSVDDYPPEAKSRASVGGMSAQSMNLEAMVALKPDLVLATAGVQGPAIAPLERLGLVVVALDAERPEDVPGNIRAIGRLVGAEAKADEVAASFEARLAAVRSRVAARPGPRPRVLYLLYADPLMTVGPRTILGRMLDEAGGENIFADLSQNYPTPSDEEVVVRRPEVILATFGLMNPGGDSEERDRERLLKRPGWRDVPAVRDARIHPLDEDLTTRAGPRLIDGLEAMERALAP